MLSINKLSVSYASVRALNDVDLEIDGRGSVVGIIGPNGAGKSTLMDAISGRVRRFDGTVLYQGKDLRGRSAAWRRRQGMSRSFQRTSIFPELTVRQQLDLVSRTLGDPAPDEIWGALELTEVLDVPACSIAYGVQRRVDVALALLGRPTLLLLDEPGAGLSAPETKSLFTLLRSLVQARGITAVVVEHDVDAVFDSCDRVAVLNLGQVLAFGPPAEVRRNPEVIKAYLGTAA